MNRAINFFVILATMLVIGCDTANNVEPVFRTAYVKYYGTEGDQYAADILVHPSGEFYLLGNSVSLSGTTTAFLIKTDLEGRVIWRRQVGGDDESAADVELINTGSYSGSLAIGLNVGPEGSSRIRVVRVGQDGVGIDSVILPLHKFGGYKQVVKSITSFQHTDEYVVTGYADQILIKETAPIDPSNDVTDILAFRLDNALTLIDTVVTKGGERDGTGIRVFEMDGESPGKLAIFSCSDRPYQTNTFGYNFSYDIVASGIPIGNLVGTENDQEILSAVIKVPYEMGAGFFMAGTSKAAIDGSGDLYVVKFDSELKYKSLDLKLSLGRNLQCIGAANAAPGFYLLSNEITAGQLSDITLLKILNDGSVEWTKSFGTREGDDSAAAVTTLPDGRIAIAATMELQTRRKFALIVLNNDGSF